MARPLQPPHTRVQVVHVRGLQLRSDHLVLHHFGEFRVIVRLPRVDLVEKAVVGVATDIDDAPQRRHHFAVGRGGQNQLPTARLMNRT